MTRTPVQILLDAASKAKEMGLKTKGLEYPWDHIEYVCIEVQGYEIGIESFEVDQDKIEDILSLKRYRNSPKDSRIKIMVAQIATEIIEATDMRIVYYRQDKSRNVKTMAEWLA